MPMPILRESGGKNVRQMGGGGDGYIEPGANKRCPWLCPCHQEGHPSQGRNPQLDSHRNPYLEQRPWRDMGIHIDGLVQYCSISSALAMEILQSCIEQSICVLKWVPECTLFDTMTHEQNGRHFVFLMV